MSETAQWLRQAPWQHVTPPDAVLDFPSMLYPEERKLLFQLGQTFRGEGAIVDAGCFLGGSTFALASGLHANDCWHPADPAVIHSYDLFHLDEQTRATYPALVGDVPAGGSLRPTFDRLLAPFSQNLNVLEGDIRDLSWQSGPIEVLFIDICKSWETNDHVVRQFFPALIPYRSVVVQQDFVHEWLPHIPVAMGLLADAFEFAGFAWPSSALFVPTRAIDPDELPSSLLAETTDEDKLAYFDRACAAFPGAEERAILDCARAVLLGELGHHSEAVALIDGISPHISERVTHSRHETRSWLLRSHPDPAIATPAWEQWHAEHGR